MAKKSGLGQGFFAHGFDISGDVGVIDNGASPRDLLDVTGIDKSAHERINGLSDGLLVYTAWFNDAAGQAHFALRGVPTTDVILLWAMSAVIGDKAAGLVAKQMNYDGSRGADGSLTFAVEGRANGTPLEWLDLLTAGKITHSSATNGTSDDNAVSTADGLIGYLEMVDIASGTPTISIEDSVDDAVFVNLVSFAAIADGAEPTAERVTITGTVNRYLRAVSTGTFTNAQFVVATRRGTAQDDVSLA